MSIPEADAHIIAQALIWYRKLQAEPPHHSYRRLIKRLNTLTANEILDDPNDVLSVPGGCGSCGEEEVTACYALSQLLREYALYPDVAYTLLITVARLTSHEYTFRLMLCNYHAVEGLVDSAQTFILVDGEGHDYPTEMALVVLANMASDSRHLRYLQEDYHCASQLVVRAMDIFSKERWIQVWGCHAAANLSRNPDIGGVMGYDGYELCLLGWSSLLLLLVGLMPCLTCVPPCTKTTTTTMLMDDKLYSSLLSSPSMWTYY